MRVRLAIILTVGLALLLVALGIRLTPWYRALFTPGADLAVRRVPSKWLRAQVLRRLQPERPEYQWYESSVFPRGNAVIRAMTDTGPYAEGLLRPQLTSGDPDVRLFTALALLDLGGEEAKVQLRNLVRDAQRSGSGARDEARGYMAAEALVEHDELVGLDYVAGFLPQRREVGRRARRDFEFLIFRVAPDLPECEALYEIGGRRNDPVFGQKALAWYAQNREALASALAAQRSGTQ